ncbi:hypothetical protein GCM10028811_12470 [Uliginosibacterium sediminicola]
MNAIPPMTDERGRHWRQPSCDRVLIDDTHAVVSKADFDMLSNYSTSNPSGVYPGKMWRAEWAGKHYLRWFGDGGPTKCTNNQRLLIVV